jgi:hypothetical protein
MDSTVTGRYGTQAPPEPVWTDWIPWTSFLNRYLVAVQGCCCCSGAAVVGALAGAFSRPFRGVVVVLYH